jgi:uncharacterized protein
MPTLADIRRFSVTRSLQQHSSLQAVIEHLGFVQADPIRAPARAQDLILRLRLPGYKAGDLEAQYPQLPVEEDFSINYGFMPQAAAALLHPRQAARVWTAAQQRQAQQVLAHIRSTGQGHPRQLAQRFGTGTAQNAWGGQSAALTQLLDGMHYRSMLRVARRESGTRVYAPYDLPAATYKLQDNADHLLKLLLKLYAPATERGLRLLCRMLARGAPQLRTALPLSLKHLLRELPQTRIDGTTWLWPEGESLHDAAWPATRQARLLAPFDPIVWDRSRFEQLWGWAYRFEAYTPAPKRRLGYYALPLLVGTEVLGWANLKLVATTGVPRLHAEIGFVRSMAAYRHLHRDVEADLQQFAKFIGLNHTEPLFTRHRESAW